MAASLKASVATAAALFTLFFGVGVAQAGLVDEVVEGTAPVVNNAVPDVDEAVPDVDEAVGDVAATADETVVDAKAKAEEVLAQATTTADEALMPAKPIVDKTPVGKVLSDVEQVVDPVVAPAYSDESPAAAAAEGAPTGSTGAPTAGSTAGVTPVESSASAAITGADGGEWTSQVPSGPLEDAVSRHQVDSGTLKLLSSFRSSVWVADSHDVSRSDSAASSVPPSPLEPLFPAGTPAASALAVAATGVALTAALLAAFMFVAPRAGRRLRPGPSLGRPPSLIPAPERPG